MKKYDVKRLALVLSIQAEIEGMKVENKQREDNGYALAFRNEQFMHMAKELESLANKKDKEL